MSNKILITGACGFIGSHLVDMCIESGLDVVAFDRYNSNNHKGWLEESEKKDEIEVILGDIRDLDSVTKAMANCDAVFHLAALIGIPYSYVSPLAYIRTNIEGTYNVLEAARNKAVEQIIVTSTSEVYGSAQYSPIDEMHPLAGQSPYAATKIAADQLALSYFRSFDSPVKIVRPFNTYGPRQSARAIIPTVIAQCQADAAELQLGNLSPTRDLTYVKDTCTAFLEIYHSNLCFGQVVNVGMKSEISVEDLATKIAKLMQVNIEIAEDTRRVRPQKSEVDRLICENERLSTISDWRPAYDLTQGLTETIAWFNQRREHALGVEYIV